jgi:RNA polymerase sigma factor (sigma-70 family)
MRSKVHNIKSDQDIIIKGILSNDPSTIKSIYNDQFDKISAMVNNFMYINLEPDDVFQEGLTRAVINIRKGVFKGDSSFSTYLYGICRNLCLKEYNRNRLTTSNEIGDIKEEVEDDYFDSIQLMVKLKDKLDNNCKEIIDLRFGIGDIDSTYTSTLRFEKIAAKLNISADNARQRFGRCFSKLKKLVASEPMFNELMD